MAQERVLVLGAGLLGSRLVRLASGKYEVHVADLDESLASDTGFFHKLDITDRLALEELVLSLKPSAVFHTAALTNVDRCEVEPSLAMRVNAVATGHVAIACAKARAFLCYISTDYVFDGQRGMYRETDRPNPLSVYGRSKLTGENDVECLGKRWPWLIARSSVLYGAFRKRFNFATWIIDELRAGREIRVVTDQFASPTLADDLADACLRLWEKGGRGIFHVAGRERISRYDFAVKVCEVFGLDRSLVRPITTAELRQRARRPPDSSLDVSKVEAFLGRKMLDVREGLERMKEEERASPPGERGPSSRTV
ncbi:MAG: dTDP-4-dehydrorhamnose reductase [Thermoplasmata archaeon]